MPKFIKDRPERTSGTRPKKDVNLEEEIISPFYFPPEEDQLSQQEVAKMFRKTVQTISKWTEEDKIPFYRLGKFPIYSRKQLILFASKNRKLISE